MRGTGDGQYSLFVDETGNFRTDRERWAVAGILLPADAANVREPLRQVIAEELPQVPYPPHATEMRLDGAHAAYALALEIQEGKKHPDAVLHEAANQIRANRRSAWAADLLEAIRNRGELDRAALLAVEPACSPRAKRRLAQARVAALEGVRKSLARGGDLGAVAIAAVIDPAHSLGSANEYLDLLQTVFERAVAFVAPVERSGRASLDVCVASRRLGRDNSGVPLSQAIVSRALKAACQYVSPLCAGRVDFPNVEVWSARSATVPAGIVLADFVANNLPAVVAQAEWVAVEAAAADRLRVAVRTACVPLSSRLPTLAAFGSPQLAIRAAMRGAVVEALNRVQGWHSEQAYEWVEAITRVRRPTP